MNYFHRLLDEGAFSDLTGQWRVVARPRIHFSRKDIKFARG